jgi:hypothetical protein
LGSSIFLSQPFECWDHRHNANIPSFPPFLVLNINIQHCLFSIPEENNFLICLS